MLTQEQIQFYEQNGYLLVKGLFSKEEAETLRREAHAITDRLMNAGRDIDATWGSVDEVGAKRGATVLMNCHDVQFHSGEFTKMIVNDRFTKAASQIMGTENIQLHHTKMFIKPPEKGSPFPMHQDYHYFPHAKDTMIAAIVHLDSAPLEKGCVRVYPGTHKLGPLEQISEGGWHLPASQYSLEGATPCPAEAGDVLYFSYLTIHGSGINVSDEARTTVLVQMRDADDPPTEKTHISRGQGTMLRGVCSVAAPWPPAEAM